MDLPIQSLRRRDAKNGLAVPPRFTARTAWEILSHPAWALGVFFGKQRTFGNLATFFPRQGAATLAEWSNAQLDPTMGWKDVEWVRARWPGKLVVKGILDAEDARLAAAAGVDAVIVSNHGGRQLDSATSTISALPHVVNAIAGRCEVLLDGGITSGQNVLKALALGARACFIGKAFLYGLAAKGESGVSLALSLLRRELEVSMALTGTTDVRNVHARTLITS
jgi:L-lactate dehydrogenase (cytochrome)